MALEPCRECGKAISTEAPTCPNCGIRNPHGPQKTTARNAVGSGFAEGIGMLIFSVAIGFVFFLILHPPYNLWAIVGGCGAGVYGLIRGFLTIEGPCPYCGRTLQAHRTDEGVKCRACNNRVVLGDKEFLRVD